MGFKSTIGDIPLRQHSRQHKLQLNPTTVCGLNISQLITTDCGFWGLPPAPPQAAMTDPSYTHRCARVLSAAELKELELVPSTLQFQLIGSEQGTSWNKPTWPNLNEMTNDIKLNLGFGILACII